MNRPAPEYVKPYSLRDLISISDDIDKYKLLIIEVGGERISLKHVYVITEEEAGSGNWPESAIGSLVLDLDI